MSGQIKFGTTLYLQNTSGTYLCASDGGITKRYFWPRIGDDGSKKVALQIVRLSSKQKKLRSGDVVRFKTAEPKAGDRDTLGAFQDSHDCYYWNEGYNDKKQGWIIKKVGAQNGDIIYYGDEITIVNVAYQGQHLVADNRYKGYITTKKNQRDIWRFEAIQQRDEGENEWTSYYDKFTYFSHEKVRDGCYPRIMEQPTPTQKSIVLVQGLTDSPYFMTAIGRYFFEKLGYNVYIPLLQGHGLVIPSGMEGVSLQEWKANVEFAIDTAIAKTPEATLSIGGLSTGGALSCYMAATNSKVNGSLYLFSAALDIAGNLGSGNLKEQLLKTFMADVLDSKGALIGENPYRYTRMDKDGARELSKQIEEIDRLIAGYSPGNPFPQPIFAAHSESDTAADIKGIEALRQVCNLDQFRFFRIQEKDAVGHAELVLEEPVRSASGKQLEKPNPKFDEMMEAIAEFEQTMANQTNTHGKFQLQALSERLDSQGTAQADAQAIVNYHRTILANQDALLRYATIAQAVYTLDSAAQKCESVGGELLTASMLRAVKGEDGLQAICVAYPKETKQELIVAYRGTDNTNPDDLITDGGVVSVLTTPISDDIIRTLIYREMVKKTWRNAPVAAAAKGTLAGQLGQRIVNAMKYYQAQAETFDFDEYDRVTVVGHSLGGVISASVSYWASEKYANQDIYCHTFNSAPGAKYALVASDAECDRTISNRITNHRIIGDSVSGPPAPIGTDDEGFPYAHLGYIYNWRPLQADTLKDIAVHLLDRFIIDLKCDTQHLVGIGPSPVGKYYW